LDSRPIAGRDRLILRDWLNQAPYTLAMSSGYFGFFAHFGCLEALEEAGLAPARISGSSAGALAGALWAAGCPFTILKKQLFCLKKSDFWDPGPGFGLLKGIRFRNMLAKIFPVAKIEDCRVPLVISAFDLAGFTTRCLREGPICDVVYASCCVPFLFQPIRIGKSLLVDGGIGDRPGLAGVPADGRILYHHLQSGWPGFDRDCGLSAILGLRPNTVAITVNDIEAVNPSRLASGRRAFHQTREAVRTALGQPILDRRILV
jgi:NTE family protein